MKNYYMINQRKLNAITKIEVYIIYFNRKINLYKINIRISKRIL